MTGRELRKQRLLLGLTQRELAAKLGMARNTITRYERGFLPDPEICAARGESPTGRARRIARGDRGMGAKDPLTRCAMVDDAPLGSTKRLRRIRRSAALASACLFVAGCSIRPPGRTIPAQTVHVLDAQNHLLADILFAFFDGNRISQNRQ